MDFSNNCRVMYWNCQNYDQKIKMMWTFGEGKTSKELNILYKLEFNWILRVEQNFDEKLSELWKNSNILCIFEGEKASKHINMLHKFVLNLSHDSGVEFLASSLSKVPLAKQIPWNLKGAMA